MGDDKKPAAKEEKKTDIKEKIKEGTEKAANATAKLNDAAKKAPVPEGAKKAAEKTNNAVKKANNLMKGKRTETETKPAAETKPEPKKASGAYTKFYSMIMVVLAIFML